MRNGDLIFNPLQNRHPSIDHQNIYSVTGDYVGDP